MFDWNQRVAYYLVPDRIGGVPDPYAALTSAPEAGPGYQFCVVSGNSTYPTADRLPDGRYLVLNAELFVPLNAQDEQALSGGASASVSTYEALLANLRLTKINSTAGVSVPSPIAVSTLVVHSMTRAGDVFWRFSAYASDRRITAQESVVANSYMTSDADYELVRTGLGAVGRYALPTPLPAIYGFCVRPEPGLDINVGTARPLFGQAGGGVELVLVPGSGPYTVAHHRRVLPAW